MATTSGSSMVRVSSMSRMRYIGDRQEKLDEAIRILNSQGKRVINIVDGPLMPFGPVGNVYCDVTILWEQRDESNAITAPAPAPVQSVAAPTVHINENNLDASMMRANMFLEDQEWDTAKAYFNGILDIDPTCADAYVGLYMAEKNLEDAVALEKYLLSAQFDKEDNNIKKALRFNCTASEKIQRGIAQQAEFELAAEKKAEDAKEKVARIRELLKDPYCPVGIWAGRTHTVALKSDGTAVSTKYRGDPKLYHGQCEVSDWRDIININAGYANTFGLKSDGTVVATKHIDTAESTYKDYGQFEISNWQDIVAIESRGQTVGLKSDGTVVLTKYTGDQKYAISQSEVSDWREIIDVKIGNGSVFGLKSDGTVVATKHKGSPEYYHGEDKVSDWRDIIGIRICTGCTIGLKSDGTVVPTEYTGEQSLNHGQGEVSDWKDIIDIKAGVGYTFGLKSDGTVISTEYVGDQSFYHGQDKVSDLRDIVAIAISPYHTVGLKADGTVVATKYMGNYYEGQCEVSNWRDIVAIAADAFHTVGLKADGTVVSTKCTGANTEYHGQCEVAGWKLFDGEEDLKAAIERNRASAEERRIAGEKAAEERRIAEEKARQEKIAELEKEKENLQAELPNIKGLFAGSKKKDMESRIAAIDAELAKLNR